LFPYFVELRESKIKDVGVVPDPKSLIAQRTVNILGLVSVLDPKVLDPELLVIEKKLSISTGWYWYRILKH
jgi:hypothetical protein